MYNLDYEPKAIFFRKSVSISLKQKENFVELVEIVLGVDPENNKQDTIM